MDAIQQLGLLCFGSLVRLLPEDNTVEELLLGEEF